MGFQNPKKFLFLYCVFFLNMPFNLFYHVFAFVFKVSCNQLFGNCHFHFFQWASRRYFEVLGKLLYYFRLLNYYQV